MVLVVCPIADASAVDASAALVGSSAASAEDADADFGAGAALISYLNSLISISVSNPDAAVAAGETSGLACTVHISGAVAPQGMAGHVSGEGSKSGGVLW